MATNTTRVTATKPRIERRELRSLRDYPGHNNYFANLSYEAREELKLDMQRHGLRYPIEILPNGTILCGHQRVLAALELGWTTIRCRVREDLAGDPEAARRLMIEDNLVRRHLEPLDIARCYQQLKHSPGDFKKLGGEDLRDVLAKRFRVSGRTLDRWERLLSLPEDLQRAITWKFLTHGAADRLLSLGPAAIEQAQAKMRRGISPKYAVSDVLKAHANSTVGRQEKRNRAKGARLDRFCQGVQDISYSVRNNPQALVERLEKLMPCDLRPICEAFERALAASEKANPNAHDHHEAFDNIVADIGRSLNVPGHDDEATPQELAAPRRPRHAGGGA